MSKEIVNRVQKSGIVTIDFDDFSIPNIYEIDLKDWLVDDFFLVEKKFKKPVVIINYPKQIKAFYMRQMEMIAKTIDIN